jgi:hypothetical protein
VSAFSWKNITRFQKSTVMLGAVGLWLASAGCEVISGVGDFKVSDSQSQQGLCFGASANETCLLCLQDKCCSELISCNNNSTCSQCVKDKTFFTCDSNNTQMQSLVGCLNLGCSNECSSIGGAGSAGSSGASGSSGTAGTMPSSCAGKSPGTECINCCAAALPAGTAQYINSIKGCSCTNCGAQCDNICNPTMPATPPTKDCNDCLTASFHEGNACNVNYLECKQNAGCFNFAKCLETCGSLGFPYSK